MRARALVIATAPPTLLAALTWWAAGLGYLLAHTLAELFSIVVAITALVVAITSSAFTRNQFLVFISVAIGWCAGLDLIHTMLFKGMRLFPSDDANIATQFWIAARLIQAAAMVAAPLMLNRALPPFAVHTVFGAATIAAALAIFTGYFPDAFVEGEGLTPFKIYGEYLVIALLGLSLVLLWQRRDLTSARLRWNITASVVAMMLSEFAFTQYATVHAPSNLIGHVLKIYAYWFVYLALVETTLRQPFSMMARAASTYDADPDPTYIVGSDGIVNLANRAAAKALGQSPAQLAGQAAHPLLHDSRILADQCPVCTRLNAPGDGLLVQLSLADDRFVECHVAPFGDQSADRPAWVMVVRDISERERWTQEREGLLHDLQAKVDELHGLNQVAHEAAEAAAQAEQRLRNIIETSSDIICTIDHEGRFIEISDNCAVIWGWPRAALLGRPCFDFMADDDRELAKRNFRPRKEGEPARMVHNHYVRPDGTHVPMTWSTTWIIEEGICHCIGRDMTEYNALAARVQFSQRMEAIGQLTGGVAHDFNNLLTIVIGSSETIAEETTQPQLRKVAELILRAGEQARELTRQLLAFSRRQPLEPRPLDINGLLDGTAPLIRRTLGADLEFSIEMASQLKPAFVDPTQTEAAILNLCLNARDAMPQGGKLSIRTDNIVLTDEDCRSHPEARAGEYVAIHVSDTGTGIAPEIAGRIFEPFFTTKETGKGSGLGLSMVYGFTQQSGGHIELVSEPGQGTTFTLHLPVANVGDDEIVPAARARRAIDGGSETVLIVEDNDLVREHVRGQFISLGYQVVVASTGAEALAILERRDDIELLFTDIVMPGGINGRELGEIAAARWPALHILYTSGYSRDALTQDGRLVEGVTLLSKPYSKAELAEKTRAVLGDPA